MHRVGLFFMLACLLLAPAHKARADGPAEAFYGQFTGAAEERIRDCVLAQADQIREHWREFPRLDRRYCPLSRGAAWTGWLAAVMHRITGEEEWARILSLYGSMRHLQALGVEEGE